MEQKRLDLYTFSERQLILLNTCINAWRGSTFWALMYMQSRLFHAENVDSIYRELQAQPAQYDQIMERHNTTLLCDAADQDLLGNYHAISASYLLLDQLACEMGEYMSVGIIRQFHIS